MSFNREPYVNLLKAAESKELQEAALLLADDPKIDNSTYDQYSSCSISKGEKKYEYKFAPIHWAVYHDNRNLIEKLVKANPNRLIQKTTGCEERTVIEMAIVLGKWEVATHIATTFVKEYSNNIKKKNEPYNSQKYNNVLNLVLIYATEANKIELVKALLNAGLEKIDYSIFFRYDADKTVTQFFPLHFAVYHNNIEMINLLINAKFDPFVKGQGEKDITPVQLAIHLKREDCIIALTSDKAPSDRKQISHTLISTAHYKDLQKAALCLANHPKTNIASYDLKSSCSKKNDTYYPIHWAIYHNNIALVRALIKDPERLIQKTNHGYSAIVLAAWLDNWDIVNELADIYGNEFRKKTKENQLYEIALSGALVEAAKANKMDSVRRLLKAGAKDNCRHPSNHMYALHYAVEHNNIEMIEELIKAGHDRFVTDKEGTSPMTLALQLKQLDCVAALEGKKIASRTKEVKEDPAKIEVKTIPSLEVDKTVLPKKETKENPAKLEAKTTPSLEVDKTVLPKEEAKENPAKLEAKTTLSLPIDKTVLLKEEAKKVITATPEADKKPANTDIDHLSSLIRSGHLKELKTRLTQSQDQKIEIFNKRNNEGLTLPELAIIYKHYDIFVLLANNKKYQATSDSAFHIIKSSLIKKLKKYNDVSYKHLTEVLNEALAYYKNDNKPSPYNIHFDSLQPLIEQIASGKLSRLTLKKLARQYKFKETVLNYLEKLSSHFERLDKILKLDEDSCSEKDSLTPLEQFFGVKRGFTKTTLNTGTFERFFSIKGSWKKNAKLRGGQEEGVTHETKEIPLATRDVQPEVVDPKPSAPLAPESLAGLPSAVPGAQPQIVDLKPSAPLAPESLAGLPSAVPGAQPQIVDLKPSAPLAPEVLGPPGGPAINSDCVQDKHVSYQKIYPDILEKKSLDDITNASLPSSASISLIGEKELSSSAMITKMISTEKNLVPLTTSPKLTEEKEKGSITINPILTPLPSGSSCSNNNFLVERQQPGNGELVENPKKKVAMMMA